MGATNYDRKATCPGHDWQCATYLHVPGHFFECWIQGVAAIMEHPAKAWWSPHLDRLPSVWDSWPARVLTTLPGCQLTHLNQDQDGQVSKKPTTLLSVHTSGLASALGRWAQAPPCARVADGAIGFDVDAGEWPHASLRFTRSVCVGLLLMLWLRL